MSDKLSGKIALVTGAGSGMGRSIAREFASAGAAVAAIDINADTVEAMVAELDDGAGLALTGDISDSGAVARMVREAEAKFGRVDILVNCAGVLDDYASITNTDEALWDRVININLKGAFLLSRAVLPGMVDRRGGAIVNIASIAGMVAGGGGAAYTSSKHGIIGLTRQTAYDYGPAGVRANAICPGAIETSMTKDILNSDNRAVMDLVRSVPAGRHGQPEEVAKLALYLASDDAAFMHGAILPIDGGWTVR